MHLLDVVAQHLGTWAVALANNRFALLVLLVVDVVVLEQVDGGDYVLLCKLLCAVEVIFVGSDISLQYVVEQEGEEVALVTNLLYRVVE